MGKAATASISEAKSTPPKTAKPAPEPKAIVTVNAKALSLDVGPHVIGQMASIYKDEEKLNALALQLNSKRYETLASLTQACIKAANADDSINLAAAFSGDVKAMNLMNDQLGLALGVREVVQIVSEQTGKTTAKIGYSKAVAKFFPQAGARKDDPENIKKATLRTNYLHQLKKAAQAACAIIDKGIVVKNDAKAGTLMISGPAVVEEFGSDNILLNEKQKITTPEGEVTLKAKPSFTALKDMGARAFGKSTPAKPATATKPILDPDAAVQATCKSLISVLSAFKQKPSDGTKESFKSVQSAIDRVLKL